VFGTDGGDWEEEGRQEWFHSAPIYILFFRFPLHFILPFLKLMAVMCFGEYRKTTINL